MARTKALELDTWKLRFRPRDKPSHCWQGVGGGGYVLLIEHTVRGETRVREVTPGRAGQ